MNIMERHSAAVLLLINNLTIIRNVIKTQHKKYKKFSAKWLLRREEEGFTHKLLKEIECEDSKLYKNILRMTPHQFSMILEKVKPHITKQDTHFRNCIGPAERLHVTLRYLATGETQASLQLLFRIQQSTISKILKETIPAIFVALNEDVLQFPDSENDWQSISKDFYEMWGFPNCLGAIDGKHCVIRGLKNAGSTYFNYKGNHSIILMGIADAKYRFLYADVGTNGRVGDAGVWLRSDLKYAIENAEVNIPPAQNLPSSNIISPFTFLADDAFALTVYMLKPYAHKNLTEKELHFNYMLSRSRRVIENAFGILANRFRVLFTPIHRDPAYAAKIVLACICLHNFLRNDNIKENYNFDNFTNSEIDEIIRENYEHITADRKRDRKSAEKIRDTLADYFYSRKYRN